MNKGIPSQKQLTAWCREWQKTLRLQDWRIRIRYTEKHELDDCQGDCHPDDCLRAATIRVNPFSNRDDKDGAWCPYEVVIIHELVHLHLHLFWPRNRESTTYKVAEAAVDSLSWALYRAKYGGKAQDDFVDSP